METENKYQYPRVGIGVMLFNNDGKILLGKRKGSHGAGEYSFPGGHLENGENLPACAMREVIEETGIVIHEIEFQFVQNTYKYKPKHYVHIGVIAKVLHGDPVLREPDKCEGWDWYDLYNLPKPIFELAKIAIDSYKKMPNVKGKLFIIDSVYLEQLSEIMKGDINKIK